MLLAWLAALLVLLAGFSLVTVAVFSVYLINSASSLLLTYRHQRELREYYLSVNAAVMQNSFLRFFKGHLPQLQQAEQKGFFFHYQLGEWYVVIQPAADP